MSRTQDFCTVSRPEKFPSQVVVVFEKSVTYLGLLHRDDNLFVGFVIAPTYVNSPLVPRTIYYRTGSQKKPKDSVLQKRAGFKVGRKKIRVYLDVQKK